MPTLPYITLFLINICPSAADVRMASQPKSNWYSNKNQAALFIPNAALYMEPSDFGYAGLKRQRDSGAYDQFLRSNIDNEQDKRDFVNEPGRDHLPFRSFEGASTDVDPSVRTKITSAFPGPSTNVTPGVPFVVPLRWNNPHSSELEVNVWIMNNAYVVPIRKPTCAGEGYQDAAFSFTVPSDFNKLGSKVPGFKGCKNVGDCVLQVYAHSVEPRQYAIGTPLIVSGAVDAATARDTTGIDPVGQDPGLVPAAPRSPLCLSSSDPSANIQSAKPRMARYISDVFNHAYQNSDFAPYSGQQSEAISQNLMAACILKMTSGNRGELGKALLAQTPAAANFQKKMDKVVDQTIKSYEALANNIIGLIGSQMQTNASTGLRKVTTCFRCAEVGSASTVRQTTTTYIPSFKVDSSLLPALITLTGQNEQFKNLIKDGMVQIYVTALNDMTAQNGLFIQAEQYNLRYQPPAYKPSIATMSDVTQFRKLDANGNPDNGLYAARMAQKNKTSSISFTAAAAATLLSAAAAQGALPSLGGGATYASAAADYDAIMSDSNCDDDQVLNMTPNITCTAPVVMFGDKSNSGPAALSFSALLAPVSVATMLGVLVSAMFT